MLDTVRDAYRDSPATADGAFDVQKRPAEFAADTSRVTDTVSYYYDKHSKYDQIWLMLPTCPLRSRPDVSNAQRLLTKEIDSVVSITEYEFPPSLGLVTDAGGNLESYDASDPWRTGNSRSQDHPTVYRPNGALYGSWWTSFAVHRNFYKGKVQGYAMPRERSIDIDSQFDLVLAEVLLGER
jgi:CMP-N-acetylneuraminic acid synthetase